MLALLARPPSISTLSILLVSCLLAESRWSPSNLFQSDSLTKLSEQFLTDGDIKTANAWKFEDCGSVSDAVEIKSLEIDPDPPKPGDEVVIKASGTVNQLIEDGAYADVVVKLGLIKLLHKTFDICEEMRKNNATLQCPIQPGDYDIIQKVELPKQIPPARFVVQVRAFTNDDEDMACANAVADFTP